jgi:histidyl-tRNA synthetase
MRDFLPTDKAKRERALSIIRKRYAAHGFDEIETPVLEDIARLHSGLGGDNEKLSFSVLKRGVTADELRAAAENDNALELADLGLRFDLTVPLARFYASNRAELPTVFRSIQIAPVWRAERPQKGRYRQFMQCDIDIIGESGQLAELELITATIDTLAALGLTGCTVRINDRRLLIGMLDAFGFEPESHAGVLITIDKLDKIGPSGVLAELRGRLAEQSAAIDELAAYFEAQAGVAEQAAPASRVTVAAIESALPAGVDPEAVTALATLGEAVGDGLLRFDPFLVRGMGYYTGTILEIEHPDYSFALGGGGRYDGMIGRFLGTDVPAVGFSIGFERIVDMVSLPDGGADDAIVLLYDRTMEPLKLVRLKSAFVGTGARVRIEKRSKNTKLQLEKLTEAGFTQFGVVSDAAATIADVELRPLG